MAGTLHHRFPPFLLLIIALSMICSCAYSDRHSPSTGPPFHHDDKPLPGHNPPLPGHNPPLPPQSHDKPSPIPIHKPPHDHMKPPTSPPHPLEFPHPTPLVSKPHPPPVEKHQPPKPVQNGRHPSPPGKRHYPIKPPAHVDSSINVHHPEGVPLNPPVHMIPPAVPHDHYPNPTPYKSRPPPSKPHRPPSPLNPKTPLQKIQKPASFNHNINKPIHHVTPVPPSYLSPHFYKSPPPHVRHGGIHSAPPIHH